METRPWAVMVGETWEMGESQLGDLVFRQTRCTQMRVRPCGPAKQFIHSPRKYLSSATHVPGTREKQVEDMNGLSLPRASILGSVREDGS